jgi:hypothetical protein
MTTVLPNEISSVQHKDVKCVNVLEVARTTLSQTSLMLQHKSL